jgi:hypothetical protein
VEGVTRIYRIVVDDHGVRSFDHHLQNYFFLALHYGKLG